MDAGIIDPRKERGLAIVLAKGKQIREVIEGKYLVPSQTQPSGSYYVDLQARSCSCPDWETLGGHGREHTCKHIAAVLIVRREITMPDGTSVVVSEENHVIYPQHPSYRRSRMAEKAVFETLLHSLCSGIMQPPYKGNGRPALPLADVIFAGALKVYSTISTKEQQHVRVALRFLRVRFGGWAALGKALKSGEETLSAVASKRPVSASLAFRVARLVDVGIDDLLAGAFPPAGSCPLCGANAGAEPREALRVSGALESARSNWKSV